MVHWCIGITGCRPVPPMHQSTNVPNLPMHQAVIQFTAFLMTLRKKGLLPPDAWKWLYFMMLASVRYSLVRSSLVSTAIVSIAIVSIAIVSTAIVSRAIVSIAIAYTLRLAEAA